MCPLRPDILSFFMCCFFNYILKVHYAHFYLIFFFPSTFFFFKKRSIILLFYTEVIIIRTLYDTSWISSTVEASGIARFVRFLDGFEEICFELLHTSTTSPHKTKKRKWLSSAAKRAKQDFDKRHTETHISIWAAFTRRLVFRDEVGVTWLYFALFLL